jgi:hypothetical protein
VEVDVQRAQVADAGEQSHCEVSVVIPCLNEEDAITGAVEEAFAGLEAAGVDGEVIVVDNGSADRSAERARAAGAQVVTEPRRGYGSAYLAGLSAARGEFVVMGDGDGTYDFRVLGSFVDRLRNGADMVIGSRFKGTIERGAMPWANRYIGNPMLTTMLNVFFGCGVSDAHCGLRAVRRSVLPSLKLSATGMEFASEMVIKAGKRHLRVEEIPIEYRPRIGESKLSRFGDAWRHVRFMLVHSPTFLFAIPGLIATAVGLVALVVLAAMPGLSDPWTGVSVAFAMLVIVGAGVIQLALFSRTYAVIYLGESDETLERGWRRLRLEHGLVLAFVVFTIGFVITTISFWDGKPDPRLGILGLTLVAVSLLGAFGAFFLSILGLSEHAILRRRRGDVGGS